MPYDPHSSITNYRSHLHPETKRDTPLMPASEWLELPSVTMCPSNLYGR
jgi:hypothetical protein